LCSLVFDIIFPATQLQQSLLIDEIIW